MSRPGILDRPELDQSQQSQAQKHWIVTVFNNEINTYDEVMNILMIATNCSVDEAYMETWEIDHLGQSVVHFGKEKECSAVAEVIRTIGIRVEVSEE